MIAVRAGLGLATLALAACSRAGPDAPPDAAPLAPMTAGSAALAASAPPPVPPRLAPARPELPPCRVIASTIDAGASFAVGAPITTWLTLPAGARLTVKEPATGRELILLGPAWAFPCSAAAQTSLARGRFDSSLGAGESPGAEEWVVTPSAVVRYGSARVSVTVDDSGTRAVVKSGQASALAVAKTTSAASTASTEWMVVDPAHPFLARTDPGDGGHEGRGEAARARCKTAHAQVTELEAALVDAGAGPAFGDLAVRATLARTLARAACAIAAVASLERPPEPR